MGQGGGASALPRFRQISYLTLSQPWVQIIPTKLLCAPLPHRFSNLLTAGSALMLSKRKKRAGAAEGIIHISFGQYIVDVLWCQPIKLIGVVSASEFHEY